MRKLAVLLSATMLINMLPTTGFAFDSENDGVYTSTEDTQTVEVNSEEVNFDELEDEVEETISDDANAIEQSEAEDETEDETLGDDDNVEGDDEVEEEEEDPYADWCECLDYLGRCTCCSEEDDSVSCEDSEYDCEKDDEGNCACSKYVMPDECICPDPDWCDCGYEPPVFEEEYEETVVPEADLSEWFVDLKNQAAVDGSIAKVNFPNAEVIIPEGEVVYTIEVSVASGTVMTTTPVITLIDGVTVIMTKNLANTECVYSFTINGVAAGISREAAEELLQQITFTRSGTNSMTISIGVDGRYTNLPAGSTLVAGKDSDGLGGHYYGHISNTGITWVNSYNQARTLYYKGMQGYLVTVTRAEEEAVLTQISANPAWTGGVRATYSSSGAKINGEIGVSFNNLNIYSKTFYWPAGPEAGHEFLYDANGKTTVGYNFQILNNSYYNPGTAMNNTASGKQAFIMMNSYSGWNDLSNDQSSSSGTTLNRGYFIEFGDDLVPTSGPSNTGSTGEGATSGEGMAQSVTLAPYAYVTFNDDLVYDGMQPNEENLIGATDDTTLEYYKTNANGQPVGDAIAFEDLIDAGTYVALITISGTVLEQHFEITPKPIYVSWEGGPYEYNSLEHTPVASIIDDYLVVRQGETELDSCYVVATETKLVSTTISATEKRAGVEAGSHKIDIVEFSNPNYVQATDGGYTFTVTQKPIYAEFTNLTTVYNGGTQSPTITLAGVCEDVNSILDDVKGVPSPWVTNPGEYTVKAVLSGGHANNYILTEGISCTYTVNKMPVGFDILEQVVQVGTVPEIDSNTDNTATTDDLNDRISVNLDYTITYMDENGNVYEGPNAPDIEGIYDVYIEITNQNLYRHEDSTNGDSIKVGVILVVEDVANADYSKYAVTLTYDDGNEVSTVTDVVDVLKGTIEILQTPTQEGYTFVGWKYVNKIYKAGTSFEITKDCTLEAVWSVNGEGSFGGGTTTEDDDGDGGTILVPVAGATVTLWEGDTLIAEAVTDADGHYDFGFEVPDGYYNLKAEKDGTTITSLVEVDKGVPNETDINMPSTGSNSIVTVAPGMTGVIVGGLDEVASNSEVDGTYRVTVDEEISDEFSEALEGTLKTDGIVVDVEITFDGILLDSVDDELAIVVKLPVDMQSQSSYLVYSYDEKTGEVIKLTTNPNENGDYYVVSSDRTYVTIYTSNSDTFVVDSQNSSGSLAVSSKVTIADVDNGTLSSNKSTASTGEVVTITPSADAGYVFDELYVTDIFGNPVEFVENSDGSYSFVQPSGGVTVSGKFVEDDKNGSVGVGNIGVYNPDGTLETVIQDGLYEEVIVTGVDGEVIARFPGSGGDIYLPVLALADGEKLEGWYTTTDGDGNLVFKPIITTPTSGEADFGGGDTTDENIGGGDNTDENGGGIDVYYDDEIVDRFVPVGGGDIIVLGPNDEEIARIPVDADTDKIVLPSLTLPGGQVVEGWITEVDPDGNVIYRPILSNTNDPYNNDNDGKGNTNNEDSDKDDTNSSNIDEDSDLKVPVNPNDKTATSVPQTNDSLTYVIWFIAMLASAFVITLINRKKI